MGGGAPCRRSVAGYQDRNVRCEKSWGPEPGGPRGPACRPFVSFRCKFCVERSPGLSDVCPLAQTAKSLSFVFLSICSHFLCFWAILLFNCLV